MVQDYHNNQTVHIYIKYTNHRLLSLIKQTHILHSSRQKNFIQPIYQNNIRLWLKTPLAIQLIYHTIILFNIYIVLIYHTLILAPRKKNNQLSTYSVCCTQCRYTRLQPLLCVFFCTNVLRIFKNTSPKKQNNAQLQIKTLFSTRTYQLKDTPNTEHSTAVCAARAAI